MHKLWKIASVFLFPATALASEITVYGMIDSYVQYYNDGSDSYAAIGSGGKGGSRFGIKGEENIGTGKVFFRLENGFFSDNGMNTTAAQPNGWAFQREAVLGFSHPNFGSLSVGRQYTLNFGGVAMFDAFGVSLGSTINNFMAPAPYINGVHTPGVNGTSGADNFTRRDNSVIYSTPNYSGLTLSAMMSLGEHKDAAGSQDSNTLGNSYGVQTIYRNGALATGLTWSLQSMVTPFSAQRINNNLLTWGASYDFGCAKAYLNLVYKHAEKANAANPTVYVFGGSLKTPLTGGFLLNGFHYLKNNTSDQADAWNVSARYDYSLNKRTTLYAGGVYLHNQKNVNYTINGGGGASSAPGNSPMGKNPWTFFMGMNHTF